MTRAISDRVRPRRSFMGTLARVPLGPVGGLTAVVVAVALAFGGGSSALNTAGDALNVRSAKSKVSAQGPSANQYNNNVVVCINGFYTTSVSPSTAATLVAFGAATYGPCGGGPF